MLSSEKGPNRKIHLSHSATFKNKTEVQACRFLAKKLKPCYNCLILTDIKPLFSFSQAVEIKITGNKIKLNRN